MHLFIKYICIHTLQNISIQNCKLIQNIIYFNQNFTMYLAHYTDHFTVAVATLGIHGNYVACKVSLFLQ